MENGNKKIIPNDQGLPIKEYFKSLPKAKRKPVNLSAPKEELVQEIAHQFGKTPMTARRWLYGYVEPCLAEKEKLAAMLSCTVDSLFPTTKQKKDGRRK